MKEPIEDHCISCGNPRSNHPYRHPFVPNSVSKLKKEPKELMVPLSKVEALCNKAYWKGIFDGNPDLDLSGEMTNEIHDNFDRWLNNQTKQWKP